MLEQARQKQINLGLQNVEFLEADVEIVEFSDRCFDVIFCSLAICYLTDISAALEKWHSWLKLNGTLALNVWAEKAFPHQFCLEKSPKDMV